MGGVAFEVLRWVGIAYLLYMAISTWRSGALALDSSAPPQSAMRTIGNAILGYVGIGVGLATTHR